MHTVHILASVLSFKVYVYDPFVEMQPVRLHLFWRMSWMCC